LFLCEWHVNAAWPSLRHAYLRTTKTPPEHDHYVMTPDLKTAIVENVMRGLQHANAFVIQFRGTDEAHANQLPGRLEHVASGRTATFESVEELPQLLRKMLQNALSDDEEWIG
jgi:hypothetical protein